MKIKESFPKTTERYEMGLTTLHTESASFPKCGHFSITVRDIDGTVLDHREIPNLIVYDAGILAAYQLTAASPSRLITMLAIGSGATGPVGNPDAADPRQRSLNNEIARKAFSTVSYVDATGATAAVPTHVVDYSVTFGVGEAVGALTEMSLIAPFDSDPLVTTPNPDVFPAYDDTRDIANYDVIVNYATFPVVNKPVNATLSITWRLTY